MSANSLGQILRIAGILKISDSKEAWAFGDLSEAFVANFKDFVAELAKFRHIRYHCLELSKSDSRTLEIFDLENTFPDNYKMYSSQCIVNNISCQNQSYLRKRQSFHKEYGRINNQIALKILLRFEFVLKTKLRAKSK